MTDQLRHSATLIDALGSALRRGEHGLSAVPALLKQILIEGSWREFITKRGEHVTHERFADFVMAPPLKGLGSDVALIERIIAADNEAIELLREALKEKPGRKSHNNIMRSKQGTGRSYALRRLSQDAPQLHAEVIAGRLSAHAAMVQAGYRPRTFTVRADRPESIATSLRRHLKSEDIATLARLLTEET